MDDPVVRAGDSEGDYQGVAARSGPAGARRTGWKAVWRFVEAAGASGAAFYPVIGIPVPSMAVGREPGEGQDDLPPTKAEDSGADVGIHPVLVNLGDDTMESFNVRYLKATRGKPAQTLHGADDDVACIPGTLAGEKPGGQSAGSVELAQRVHRRLEALDFGGMLRFGHVLNRWLTRPMVPFLRI